MAGSNAAALKKLGEWVTRFERVASPQFHSQLAKEVAETTLDLVDDGFESESSPYGKAWAKKKEPDGKKILERSGKLRRSIKAKSTSASQLVFKADTPYSGYHNTGRRGPWTIKPKKPGGTLAFMSGGKMRFAKSVEHPGYPARRFFPRRGSLPRRWARAYDKLTIAKFHRVVVRGKKK